MDLNKNAAGDCGERKRENGYSSLSNRRVYRKACVVEAAHTDIQENAARLFVSHNGGL